MLLRGGTILLLSSTLGNKMVASALLSGSKTKSCPATRSALSSLFGKTETTPICAEARGAKAASTSLSSALSTSALKMAPTSSGDNEKILVLGGSGFLGQEVTRRALGSGYSVVSLSRRGKPDASSSSSQTTWDAAVDYRSGDARDLDTVSGLLSEGGFVAVVHCIGLLFDGASGLGDYNRFVSGSGSVPDASSTYDDITRLTAFQAIDAAINYANRGASSSVKPLPFVFTSAAEAGWPEMAGGSFVEENLAPDWLRRYLKAKRAVESKLLQSTDALRPVIFRPSLIYSMERLSSLPPVGAFFVGNAVGLPFVDRPVTVQSLSSAMMQAIRDDSVSGVKRYKQIDDLAK